jgi:phosphohistidine phosphatase
MSSRRLYVLRHAKSSWEDGALPDHDRPLSPRGRRAAALLSDHINRTGIAPQEILCSSALRTRETLRGVMGDVAATVEPELYGAACRDLIARLRQVPDEVESVMLIGHNPALQSLVLKLVRDGAGPPAAGETPLEQIGRKFPTGALVTLELDRPWSAIEHRSATLVDYVRPKTLP